MFQFIILIIFTFFFFVIYYCVNLEFILVLIEFSFLQVISSNKTICTLQITDTTGSHQFPAMQRLSISKVTMPKICCLCQFYTMLKVACFCNHCSVDYNKPLLFIKINIYLLYNLLYYNMYFNIFRGMHLY